MKPKRLTPFSVAAEVYASVGWHPIPIPPGEKFPVPDHPNSYTGNKSNNKFSDISDVKMWLENACFQAGGSGGRKFPIGNIALRLPKFLIGIDIDKYDGKLGGDTFQSAVDRWGELPLTWFVSSRSDGSGIRFYSIPEGLRWPGKLGEGVELIRWDHRYAIAPPSVHPKSTPNNLMVYSWFKETPRGPVRLDEGDDFPEPADFLAVPLPASWVEGLTSGRPFVDRSGSGPDMDTEEASEWLDSCPDASGEPCMAMQRTLTNYLRDIRIAGDGGGAHDAALHGAWALMGDASEGHTGVRTALDRIKKAFYVAVSERRSDAVRREEWIRIVVRGATKVSAEESANGPGGLGDPCASKAASDGVPSDSGLSGGGGGSSLFDFSRDDIGNADRFMDRYRHDARYVPEEAAWSTWSAGVGSWVRDAGRMRVLGWAKAIVRDMETEAGYIEDTKEKAAFIKFVRASGNVGKLRAMIDLAQVEKMSASVSSFDANPHLLVCPNGTLELLRGGDGTRFRPSVQEDLCRLSTGTEFVGGSGGIGEGDWLKFLNQFIPDIELRKWAQKLAGYSLFGANPSRVLVIVKGPTSSGKTTFCEAIRMALGAYAGPFSLSMLRSNQDERPRADIVEALPRRFIVAEEASAEWHLHADQVKRATGGNVWAARIPYGAGYVERIPAFVPWIVTNATPTILGSDPALRRRIRVIPFNETIDQSSEIGDFKERLSVSACRSSVLSWLVEGWRLYLEDETLTDMPQVAAEATMETLNEFSEFDVFLSQVCEEGPEYQCSSGDLYDAYVAWMHLNGSEKETVSSNKFGRILSAKGFGRKDIWKDNGTKKFRIGIRLASKRYSLE